MHISADSKLSVNKAAMLWGISTATIYKALDSGTLARSGDGKLMAAEMMRVFGRIKSEVDESAAPISAPQIKPKVPPSKKSVALSTTTQAARKPRTKKNTPTAQVSTVISSPARQHGAEAVVNADPPIPPAPQLAPAMRSISPQLEQQLRQQITLLEQQLQEAKTREDWLKAQINELWTEKVELQNAKKGVLGRLLG